MFKQGSFRGKTTEFLAVEGFDGRMFKSNKKITEIVR
jgi:hypothetical protein